MPSSLTFTDIASFTVTHARHMAAKVATDLKRMQRLYGAPSDLSIADFEAELIDLMKASYLGTVTYGFRRDGAWIVPTLRYTAQDLSGAAANDDDPAASARRRHHGRELLFLPYLQLELGSSHIPPASRVQAYLALLPRRSARARGEWLFQP
jgi:Bacterial HORMA domain family 1